MIIPYLFIFGGLYIYYYNFGWTFHFTASSGFYSSAFLILIGLFLLLNTRWSRM